MSPTTAAANPFGDSSAIDMLDPDVDPALPLGLTFSFPVEQTALNQGRVLTWTKGFSAKNAIGNDVVQLLQDAFNRKHLHVRCVALVNDVCLLPLIARHCTDGLFRPLELFFLVLTPLEDAFLVRTPFSIQHRSNSRLSCVGAIFGTGTNGAYVEKVENITKLGDAPVRQNGGYMVINTEWGGFNNTVSEFSYVSIMLRRLKGRCCSVRYFPLLHSTISLIESPSILDSKLSRSSSLACTSEKSPGTSSCLSLTPLRNPSSSTAARAQY